MSYANLKKQLNEQLVPGIQVLYLIDSGESSIGTKRNVLLSQAQGEYVAFIDDDDRISDDYISEVMTGIELGIDCCSLVGEITTDGKDPKVFVHSIKYKEYFEENGVYYRPPNHLNVIRREIATQFKFPRIDHGEDTDWAMQICNSGILKNEHQIKRTIYYYDYVTKKV